MNCRPLLSAAVVAMLLLAPLGCKEVSEAFVHIDNGHHAAIAVYVDDVFAGEISPGHSRRLTLPLGEHHFRVLSAGQPVYDTIHHLDSGNRPYRTPVYVLNPDGNNRYCEVEMATNAFEPDAFSADHSKVTLVNHWPEREPDLTSDDRTIRARYQRLTQHAIAHPQRPFFKIKRADFFFGPLPSAVLSNDDLFNSPSALTRVSARVHKTIIDAKEIESPSEQDLERLEKAVNAAVRSVPIRSEH
ncbi:hypothetical protein [Rhodopirellula sp. MGV]|uniref:hypothetical protein n=1 Tax=Rhodopirellula sp. MGV TaxID=2023130 RepID=UPI000B96EFB4|nr:hypothetical protein [Rhodopirellula sp. MGV]OYP28232.1 hypothetical protein CGZ80_27310 [Rhodopirellula sp. MGV]PNY34234.1 hypothetical protein C2E31_24395 [Rhodopirellula baltica]